MKTYITSLFIITAMLLIGCDSTSKKSNQSSKENTEQTNFDDHKNHDHGKYDGHKHDDNKDHEHTEGDGHDHASEGLKEEDGHFDEILFTKEQAKVVGLTTETIVPATFQQVIKTSGQIQVAQGDEVTIVATSNGIISFTNPSISEGTPIIAGQSIVNISAKELLEGDPAVKAKIAYETVQKELQRANELIKEQIISTKEYEQIKLRYETARTTYEAQASNLTASGISVKSPISGYVKNRIVGQGEYVSVGQPIAIVSQNKRLQLRAEVSETYYKALRSINGANFKPAYDNVVYKLSDLNGQLLSFGKASNQQSFYIPVTFEFDNVGDIIPGAFTEVFLLANPQHNVISVPVISVTEEQGLHFVYLQLDEEGYKKQEVTLGQNNGERVQILSGLNTGDSVVTKGVYQVKLAAISSVMPEGHSH